MEYIVFLSLNLMPLSTNPAQPEKAVNLTILKETSLFWGNTPKEKEEPTNKKEVALMPVKEEKSLFLNTSKVDLNRDHYNFQTALAKLF